MIYNFVLVSGVQQNELVIHIFILFQILFPHRLFHLFIYWLRQVLVAACRLFIAVRGLLSCCGMQVPEREGSVVTARGLCCPSACGILVPRPGIKPASPALQEGFLTTGPPEKTPYRLLLSIE